MTKRTIEIDDDLNERIGDCFEEILDLAREYIKDNPDHDITYAWDLWCELDYDGSCTERIDSAVPVYTKNINDLWYLYSDEFISAYQNAGIGDGTEDNYQACAIFCYIDQEVRKLFEQSVEVQNLLEEREEFEDFE